jgi:hypothetical protein
MPPSPLPPDFAISTFDQEGAMQVTLYVGRLGSHEDGLAVSRLFGDFGSVVYAKLIAQPDLRGQGAFGVVQMRCDREAQDAIQGLNNSRFRGRTLSVRAATATEETAAGHPRMFESMNFVDSADEE